MSPMQLYYTLPKKKMQLYYIYLLLIYIYWYFRRFLKILYLNSFKKKIILK